SQTFLKRGRSPAVRSLLEVKQSERKERPGDAIWNPQLSVEGKIFFHQDPCGWEISPTPGSNAEPIEREGNASLVSQFPKQSQALLGQRLAPIIVALHEGESRGDKQRLSAHRRLHAHAFCQCPL